MTDSILVITLGGQAQVVTFALDWLLAQGEAIREVAILHLTRPDERHQRAIAQIAAEFHGDRYRGRPCRLHWVPIRRISGERIEDIRDEADAEATWRTVYDLLSTLKRQGHPLHLCIAGGRRIMGLLTLSAAMLLGGHRDRVWHMYTPPEVLERVRDGAILHVERDAGVHLIQVPMVPWGAYFPALQDLTQTPAQIIATHATRLEEPEWVLCRQVWTRLTERQRQLVRLLAAGLHPQEAADRLCISLATVNTHKTVILDECRVAWGLPDDEYLSYHFIQRKFGSWLEHSPTPPD